MKLINALLILCTVGTLAAQTNTEIHLFDFSTEDGKTTLSNGRNISNSEGYDSQPFFLAKDVLIYAGTRNGNTEILQYTKGNVRQFNNPTEGGEYSPQFIVGKRGISAVRLDPDGLQRLYAYLPRKEETPLLIKDAKVAYYVWADENTIVAADIVENDLHLVIHDLKTNTDNDLGISVGRSFHKIPNTELISFIDKSTEKWIVKSIDPKSQEIKVITPLITGTEDISWLPDGSILATKGNEIFIKREHSDWASLRIFDNLDLQKLSRIAVSPDGSQIAIVSEIGQE